ncbi:MAG: winged helix-turn-helix transcriptional regulator [Nitrososphaeraceae archaeon]
MEKWNLSNLNRNKERKVEYNLTDKGQELVESVINLLQWMRKWLSAQSLIFD